MCRAYLILVMTLTGMSGLGCHQPGTSAPGEPTLRQVDVIKIQNEPFEDTTTLTGRTEPWRETTLHFEVSGTVAEVLVEEGDIVEKDAPVAQLVPSDFQLAVAQAESELQVAQANLRRMESGSRREDLDAARANHTAARAVSEFWKSEWERAERLYRSKAVAGSERDRVRQRHDVANQEAIATKAQLDRAVAGPRVEDIAAAKAHVDNRQRGLSLAKRQLEKATLRAPFRGRIEGRFLDPGALVGLIRINGVPVVHLVDLDQIDVVVAVPEILRSRFVVGQAVKITSAVDSRFTVRAEIVSIGTVADSAAGTYLMRARLANPDGRFTGGMVVRASVSSLSSHPVIRVPVTAIGEAYGQSAFVYVVHGSDNQVQARDVTLGPIVGDLVNVQHGLSDEDLVIVRGNHRVLPGDRVQHQVVKPKSTTSPEPVVP